MGIEIRELVIRTNIVAESRSAQAGTGEGKQIDEKAIVERCVEKVLRRLNKKKDR